MTETAKTLVFVAAGVVALGAAYLAEPGSQTDNLQNLVGQSLNENIDLSAPRRLQIIKFDRNTASVREFEVAEVEGVWSLPSKENYPADATEQMAEAATCVMNRKILLIAGDTAQTHEEFGVVDPLSPNLNSDSAGVGTRVIMSDGDDGRLVDMIIGKRVKDATGQRYVRNNNQDVVYVVELDPSKLSTDFEDWIEDDLLQLNAFDLRQVDINDYSADFSIALTQRGLERRVSWERRAEIALAYDDSKSQWTLADVKKPGPDGQEMIPDAMADDEEINQDALTKLRDGLDDLLIVDVVRKPQGLSADLKAGNDFLNNREAIEDLIAKGFSPVTINGADEILSSEGQLVCATRDGVEYVLRFGQLKLQSDAAGSSDGDESGEESADAAETAAGADEEGADGDDAEKDGENLRRYLFVMARFNQDAIKRPELKELPALPDDKKDPVDGEPPAADDEEAPPNGEAAGEAASAAGNGGESADEESAADEAPDADAADADETTNDADEANDDSAKKLEETIAERKKIEEENQRLLDEYQQSIKTGQEKVADLNERFGDWYYVISNDVFKQIHLGRNDVIRKKEKKDESVASAGEAASAAGDEADSPLALPDLPPVGNGDADNANAPADADEQPTDGAESSSGDSVADPAR
jgi:hypothetical protein